LRRFFNGAVERLLGKVDAENVDIWKLPGPAAGKRPCSAPKVDFKWFIVAENFL
jgi:hypothetical protein